MKPGFALNLSLDGIGLLHRVAEGWAELGRADFDDPEFESRLAGLRARAAGLAPNGFATKLILPASQILYCEVDAPGPDRASRRAQIAAALKGRTPYAVDDLVFDWSRSGGDVRVAVVAKLTLDEAEEFAETRGFNPVSFVAIPDANQFAGEPFFGMTRKGEGRLPAGQQLTRDQDPVRIVAVAPAAPIHPEAPEPAPEKAPEPAASGKDSSPAEPAEIEPPLAEIGNDWPENAGISNNPAPRPEAEPALRHAAESAHLPPAAATLAEDFEAPFIALDDIPDPDPEAAPSGPAAAFSSRRPSQPAPADRTAPADIRTDDSPGLAESRLHLVADPIAPPAAPLHGPAIELEEAGITAPVLKIPLSQERDEDTLAGDRRRPRSSLGRALLNTLPEAKHGTQAQQKARRSGEADVAAPGIFGAPRPARTSPPARMRLGLILVAVLLLMMAAVALWSVWFAADPAPRAEAPADIAAPASIAAAEAPAPDPAPEDVAVSTSRAAEPEAPAPAAIDPAPELAAAPVEPLPDPGPATPDPATLWAAAPAAAAGPEADAPGAPAVAAAAPGPAMPDTGITPLPAPAALAADDQPQPQPLPPPYGTEIEFGPDGLIRATPDGVVTPDGFTLISGRPPVVPAPAPRPDPAPAATPEPEAQAPGDQSGAVPPAPVAATADLAADAAAGAVAEAMAALPDPADPAHAAKKPRARPAAVVERAAAARAQAAAIAAAAEAAARAEAEALASATARAVASSRRPVERPSSLAKAVEAAVSDAVTAAVTEAVTTPAPAPAPPAAAEPEEIDEPEPVQSVPDIPTTVTVAKQATVKNAIDLGKINLIGVYGSSASRRALVRMPTGRLIKVK
ncbi:MAG: hypothetical protein H5U18_07230, partial [Rhodobacteraceae bacterium]|nr:hypothetical protein [Paracoccaceae bacterium]